MLETLHLLSPFLPISPEDFSYQLALVLAGGDEQLASQPRLHDGTIDKVIVIKDVNNTREDSTHKHHQTVSTKIRLIIFFGAKDGEVLQSQQKQD